MQAPKLLKSCFPVVGLLLVAALTTLGGARVRAPDLILFNGHVVTLDDNFKTAEALAISGDRILAVGSSQQVLELFDRDATRKVDLLGKMVIPGLGDSHNHMSGVGLNLLFPSLEGSTSIADVVNVIAEQVETRKESEWVVTARIGEPAISALLKERRYPNRWDLDPVSPDNPVCIPAPHVSIVNSYALRLIGVTKDTADPPGGEIVRDPQTGEPTGVFLESAQQFVRDFLPRIEMQQRVEGLRHAMREYNRVGLLSIVEHGVSPENLKAYQQLWANGEMTVRVYLHVRLNTDLELEEIQAKLDQLSQFASYRGFGDSFLRIAGIKIGFDGGVGIGTALQRDPYRGPGGDLYHGIQRVSDEKFEEIVRMAAKRGLRVGTHNSGGLAMDKVFSIYERVQKEIDLRPMRFVAIHAQLPSLKNFDQVKSLNLSVAAQPVFQYSMGNGYVRYLGRELADQANPMRWWYDHKIPVALGSDAGVNPYDPFLGIWYTQTRIDQATGEVIGPGQVITRREALEGYTKHVAHLTFDENLKGSLEPGKLADLIVLDRNLLECPVEEIREIQVLMTVLGGQIVHEQLGESS